MSIDAIDFKFTLADEDATAAHIYATWVQWDQARSEWKQNVAEVDTYLMATDTTSTTNASNDFDHKTHRPKLTQIYDNLMANYKPGLIPNRNWVNWIGEDEEAVSKQNRNLLESYIRTKHRLNNFSNIVDLLLDDWIRTGNAFVGVKYETNIHTTPDGKVHQGYKGPRPYRISPHDIVFNPFATSFENTAKIIRSVHTMGDLERHAATLVGKDREEFVAIIERIKKERGFVAQKGVGNALSLQGPNTEEIQKYMQATWDGFGNYVNYMTSGTVEVLEYYGDIYVHETDEFLSNHKITVVDRRYVILKEPTDTWNGKPHIYHCPWRNRPNNLWGQGPLDKLVGLQFRLDHLENMRSDAFDRAQERDRVLIGNVEIEYTESGAREYIIPDGNGDVRDLGFNTEILNADLQIQEIENAMDLYAGSPREAMGFRTPGEKTKFEVSQLMNAAGRIFQHKLERFEVQILEPVINAEVEVARRAADYKDTVEIIDPENGAINFNNITSSDLYLNGRFIPIGARHYSRQQQLAQDARDMFNLLIQDPEVLMHFPSKKLAKLFEELMGFDEHDLFQPFGRMYEQMELSQLSSVAQSQLQREEVADLEDEEIPLGGTNLGEVNETPIEDTTGTI